MAREETVSWRLTALSPRSDGQPSPDMDRHGTHGMDRDLSFTIGNPVIGITSCPPSVRQHVWSVPKLLGLRCSIGMMPLVPGPRSVRIDGTTDSSGRLAAANSASRGARQRPR
jgi:hypothetical protein